MSDVSLRGTLARLLLLLIGGDHHEEGGGGVSSGGVREFGLDDALAAMRAGQVTRETVHDHLVGK